MIRLEVEDYCHDNCQAFRPDVEEPVTFYAGLEIYRNDTVIRCERRNLCKQLLRYLEKNLRKEEENGDPRGL